MSGLSETFGLGKCQPFLTARCGQEANGWHWHLAGPRSPTLTGALVLTSLHCSSAFLAPPPPYWRAEPGHLVLTFEVLTGHLAW